MRKERSSNIELLRILSIFLIIFGHTVWETKWDFVNMTVSKQLLIQTPWIGAKIGVNVFFLITGYFLWKRKEFKLKALLKLWVSVITYSWLILLVANLFKFSGMTFKNEIASIFPIVMNCYWFITVYFFVFLIHVYINKFIAVLSNKQYRNLLMIGFIYLFILSCFFLNETAGAGNTWISGIYLYLLGAYISKYNLSEQLKHKKAILIWTLIISILGMIFLIFVADELQIHGLTSYDLKKYGYFVGGNNPFGLIISVDLLLLFLNLKVKNNKVINKLAGTTLAVYMMHTNYLVIHMLFNNILRLSRYQNSIFITLFCLITSLGLLLLFMLIDIIKQKLFGRLEARIVEKIEIVFNYFRRQIL